MCGPVCGPVCGSVCGPVCGPVCGHVCGPVCGSVCGPVCGPVWVVPSVFFEYGPWSQAHVRLLMITLPHVSPDHRHK